MTREERIEEGMVGGWGSEGVVGLSSRMEAEGAGLEDMVVGGGEKRERRGGKERFW